MAVAAAAVRQATGHRRDLPLSPERVLLEFADAGALGAWFDADIVACCRSLF